MSLIVRFDTNLCNFYTNKKIFILKSYCFLTFSSFFSATMGFVTTVMMSFEINLQLFSTLSHSKLELKLD